MKAIIGNGNNQANRPETIIETLKCGGTVTAGQAVALADSTAVASLVSTYGAGSFYDAATILPTDLDANDPTLGFAIGIAIDSGTVGTFARVCTGGYCNYPITTDGSVEEGDVLKPTATAGTVEGTAGETGDLLGFGIALADDASTVLSKAYIWKRY